MTDEEWLEVFDLLWHAAWVYGTQNDRRELLAIKDRVQAAMSLTVTITDIPTPDVSLKEQSPMNATNTSENSETGGPWTRHGHSVPGVTVVGTSRPAAVARCGGPAICSKCATDAERIRNAR